MIIIPRRRTNKRPRLAFPTLQTRFNRRAWIWNLMYPLSIPTWNHDLYINRWLTRVVTTFWNGARRRVRGERGGGGKKKRKERKKKGWNQSDFLRYPLRRSWGCLDSYLIVDVSPWTGHANTFQESGSGKFSHFLPTRADTYFFVFLAVRYEWQQVGYSILFEINFYVFFRRIFF